MEASAKTSLTGAETILVVEDSLSIRTVAREALRRAGFSVLEAPNGATALEIVAAHPGPIHLVVTDMIMPGMTGPELANSLVARLPHLKVLFMSGYTGDSLVDRGFRGRASFLQKPFTSATLVAAVRSVLDASIAEPDSHSAYQA